MKSINLRYLLILIFSFCLNTGFANQKDIIKNAIKTFNNNPNQYINGYTANPDEVSYKKDDLEQIAKQKAKDNEHANMLNNSFLTRDRSFNKESLSTDSSLIRSSQDKGDVILNTYADCSKNNKSNAINCNGQRYCVGQDCHENNKGSDFELKNAITKFSVIDSSLKGKPAAIDVNTPYIFVGKVLKCRKYGYHFTNCCNDSGWGNGTFKDCNRHEEELGYAKQRGVVIYVGETKKSKYKKKQKDVYCVFDTKLAKIIQEQGRLNQLGVNFGSPKHPNCLGISTNQLAALNLDAIDLSPVINDVMHGRENKDGTKVKQQLIQGVQSQYSDYTKEGGEL